MMKFRVFLTMSLFLTMLAFKALGGGHDWKENQIKDALLAAPPVITDTATIYGWDESQGGKMTLLRLGTGEYTCLATGFSSLRLGRPIEPVPSPFCLDQNAWAFISAWLNEKNPMKPSKPYPTAPGMAWMLAGMAVSEGMVDLGGDGTIEIFERDSGPKMVKISPHIMILPLPVGKSGAMSTKYDPANPFESWIMAAKTPIEHLMIHMSDEDADAIMNAKN